MTSLLLTALVCVSAQTNLVQNPSFETWTAGVPNNWTVPANSSHAGTFTIIQETSIIKSGTSSLRLEIADKENPGFQQVIPIVAGKTYVLGMNYYVISGDKTDARIWCSFKNAAGFYKAGDWTTAVAADANIQKQLQGNGSDTNKYFDIANETWGYYTVEFKAPADATDFVFEGRSYKSAKVIWDDMSLIEKVEAGVSNTSSDVNLWIANGKVSFTANQGEVIKAFNANGQEIMSGIAVDGTNELTLSNQGVTIIRVGHRVGKVIL